MPGNTGDLLGTYTESGYTVTPTIGSWLEAHSFGAPIPSIYLADFHGNPFGSISVTGPGQFTLDTLDLAAEISGVGYEVRGFKEGLQQFSFSGSEVATGAFHTLASSSKLAIDTLIIDVASGGPGSINIDNIHVSAVPEPETWSLALVGLGLTAWMARRRRA